MSKQINQQPAEQTVQQKLKHDLTYIENEIITQQPNGRYCKYSRILHAVASYDIDKKQIVNYWKQQYKKFPLECEVILNALENLLKTNLTPINTMIEYVKNSKDTDKEKSKIIKLLQDK